MLKFARNKVVNVYRKDEETLLSHGVLDDDIYSLELNISLNISDLEILTITGKWHRWTTPECPRAIQFLQGAVGLHVEEEGFSQKVHKVVGRKACRHYANLLLECCHAAKEAAVLARWEKAMAENPDLTLEEFMNESGEPPPETKPKTKASPHNIPGKDRQQPKKQIEDNPSRQEGTEGSLIDLHVHTFPASPCSSISVDQLIEDAKNIGLTGICLTDHNYVWDRDVVEELKQKHGFLVLRGNEIITDQGDMLVFGLDRDIKGIIKLKDLREEVNKAEGFIIVPHPFRGFLTFGMGEVGLTPEKAMERPLFKLVDAVEVLNGKVTEKENAFAGEVATGLGIAATGGSDAHGASEAGVYATQFPDIINNERDLIKALKKGNYAPVVFRKDRLL